MDALRALAALCAVAALGLFGYAVTTGEAKVGLFLIFPYLVGTGGLALLAMALLFAAFVLWTLGTFRDASRSATRVGPPPAGEPASREERRASSGGVVLLGPIPIVWGSDRRILPWMIVAGAVLLVLAIVLSIVL